MTHDQIAAPPALEAKGTLSVALADIAAGWGRRQLWWTLAYQDLIAQYRRSIIGPFWITLQMTAFTLGISVLYAALFKQDFITFLPYVALGFLLWGLISGMVVNSTSSYVTQGGYIRSTSLPLSIYAFRLVSSQAWLFLHNVVPVALLLVFLRVTPSPWAILYVPLGLLLILVNGFFLSLWLGPLSARYRDLMPLISSAMQLIMFVTPVFWDAATLPNRAVVVWNPFAYFLNAVRYPLLDRYLEPMTWVVLGGITLVNAAVGLYLFGRNRRWIAHWVA